MNRKEIAEVKKTLKPGNSCISKISACYVTPEKEKKVITVDSMASLDEDELDKYIDIFKKTLSGTLGKHLNCLEFPTEQEEDGGSQNLLYEIVESHLGDSDRLEVLFDKIIENYVTDGYYCIILMYADYDIMTKASDDTDLGSDETYSHIICAICPTTLSKPTLSYNQSKNKLESSHNFWEVDPPKNAFLFPTLTDRSTNIHEVLVYDKKTSELNEGIISGVLGCSLPTSADEQCNAFAQSTQAAFNDCITYDQAVAVHDELAIQLEEAASEDKIVLTSNAIKSVLEDNEASNLDAFEEKYKELIGDNNIYLTNIVSGKFVLKMEGLTITASDDMKNNISIQEVDGKKCIVIASPESEIDVNGITAVI